MRPHLCRPPARMAIAAATLLLVLSSVCPPGASAATPAPLPAPAAWQAQDLTVAPAAAGEGAATLSLPVNYKVGRAVSTPVPAAAGELYTLAADVSTEYAFAAQPWMYRFWLQIEAMHGERVIATAASPEVVGNRPSGRLAVTAVVPAGATRVRAVLCAENKLWNIVKNQAVVRDVQLLKLSGREGGAPSLQLVDALPATDGPRTVRVRVMADWPDGTAVALTTSRGEAPRVALLEGGRAELTVAYGPDDVGAATLEASLHGRPATLRIADPVAATLTLDRVTVDGHDTPVLVQLTKDGKMLPGRYQSSVAGMFVTPPWSIDLAPGRWELSVSRGPQFEPDRRVLNLAPGAAERLEGVELRRVIDVPRLHWYGGDADGDVYHGERVYTDVTPRTATDIAQAMGLDWVGVGMWGEPKPRTWADITKVTRELSRPNFLFAWTEEKPKSKEGHACFIGLTRPPTDKAGFGWVGAARPLRNFESLQVIRASGGATFVNHPLRWWMKGTRFNTNMYASLPFDLCAAGLLDGFNVNERPDDLRVWSMLLDHGYRVAATAGADFGLDRPSGPVPGKARLYCYCPDGLSAPALASAIRNGHTIVSTGPTLLAEVDGRPPGSTVEPGKAYQVKVRAWARADQADELQRVELWAHGKAVTTTEFEKGAAEGTASLDWTPRGPWDWAAVRLTSRRGWAMTSAFYAADPSWRPPGPVECALTLEVAGLAPDRLAGAVVEVWDGVPSAVTSKRVSAEPLSGPSHTLAVPAGGHVVVRAPGGERREVTVYDAAGIGPIVEEIAAGAGRERPLLDWRTYERVLRQCRQATAKVQF